MNNHQYPLKPNRSLLKASFENFKTTDSFPRIFFLKREVFFFSNSQTFILVINVISFYKSIRDTAVRQENVLLKFNKSFYKNLLRQIKEDGYHFGRIRSQQAAGLTDIVTCKHPVEKKSVFVKKFCLARRLRSGFLKYLESPLTKFKIAC